MNNYETLLDKAHIAGLTVKEKPLLASDGRINGSKIAIRQDIGTIAEKSCVLAEELGHHYTSTGDIIDMADVKNRKQERHARLWAYNKIIGLKGLIDAYEYGCRNLYEAAEYLEGTEEFLKECVDCYREKYGVMVTFDNYCVIFIPHLMVGKIVN